MIAQIDFNRTVFVASELEQIDTAINQGHYEHLAAILNDVTPEKATEIERIQAQMRPKEFTFESQAQREFEIWSSQHINELTPAIEKEWQEKIEAERTEKLQALGSTVVKSESHNDSGSKKDVLTMSNNLHDVSALTDKSIQRLNDKGVFTVEELKKMDPQLRQRTLGPVIAAQIKSLF